ncbi:MAG: hypothetical protein GX962_14715, partial [Epulopiscium sp.]|nr:hypothetical protein [Candidatus Epulonipiscium sp.]
MTNRNIPIGNVVKDYKIGNTRIKICDDAYRDKTPEEVQEILRRISQIGFNALQ